MNKSKGFTIIELIVVIAIIAVLATIVLVNVTGYINKGKDASIKGNMATIMTNAAVYFDGTGAGDYDGFEGTDLYKGPATAITTANAAPVYLDDGTATAGAFCVTAALKDSTTYCVDSTGFKGAKATDKCTGTIYTCN